MEALAADPAAVHEWRRTRQWLTAAEATARAKRLAEIANDIRRSVIAMIDRAQLGHVGGDLSVADILVTLFGAVLSIDPEQPRKSDRDRLILSKGHCSASLYATLAHCGFFPAARLADFMSPLSPLNGHPDRTKVPGVEANTGPLGHGMPVAVGSALASRIRGEGWRTFVVLGDGELQEGSNWEAAMTAGQYQLGSLTTIVDRNRLQQGAGTEETVGLDPLGDKWSSFGWAVREVDGHNHEQLYDALTAPADRPTCIIANTHKGKGVSFMEDRIEWHHKVPSTEQVEAALMELTR